MNYYPDIAYVLVPSTLELTLPILRAHAQRVLAPPFTVHENPRRGGELTIRGPQRSASLRTKKIDQHTRRWLRERGHGLAPVADAPAGFRWTLLEILSGPNHDLDYKPSYDAARGVALAWPGAREV